MLTWFQRLIENKYKVIHQYMTRSKLCNNSGNGPEQQAKYIYIYKLLFEPEIGQRFRVKLSELDRTKTDPNNIILLHPTELHVV